MKNYVEMSKELATRLINHGPLVWISTKSLEGRYDITPIAWNCPAGRNPPMILIEVGMEHQTYENIESTQEFIAVVPHSSQEEIVRQTGSISGRDIDKFENFNIAAFGGKYVDAPVPQDCIGYLECKVAKIVELDGLAIIIADVVAGYVDKEAFDGRLLVQNKVGKTLHHLGDQFFTVPGDEVLENK